MATNFKSQHPQAFVKARGIAHNRRRRVSRRLSVERMEDRLLLSWSAIPPELHVNTITENEQRASAVAMNDMGGFVAAWDGNGPSDDNGVFMQLYDSNGDAIGDNFLVNAPNPYRQDRVAVAMTQNGEFVIAWHGTKSTGLGTAVYLRRFDRNGTPLGDETLVADTSFPFSRPSVAVDASGNFVLTWDSTFGDDNDGGGIYARLYGNDGQPKGGQFLVNRTILGDQRSPSVAMDRDGDFVIAWDVGPIGDKGVMARRFGASGQALDEFEFQVNTFDQNSQSDPAVGMNANGDFVIVWTSNTQDPDLSASRGVYGQRFRADRSRPSPEFRVNDTIEGSQEDPAVGMDEAGNFVVVWRGFTSSFTNLSNAYAKWFLADGSTETGELQVNTTTARHQLEPAVTMNSVGAAVITWSKSDSQNEDNRDIYAQRFVNDQLAQPRVRMIYLVPSDKTIRADYEAALENAIKDVQGWYGDQMGGPTGLLGTYYDTMDLTGTSLTRIDSTVGFDWGGGSPDSSIDEDTFSARWTGQVQAQYDEVYTFYTQTDDGVRLFVNGQLLIDKWIDQPTTEWSGTISLAAGQKYDIVMEYFENGGGAAAKLLWSSPSTQKSIIPQSQLVNLSSTTGKTFRLHTPAVETLQTSHPASWYATTGTGSAAFFYNVANDGFALTGGKFDDPKNRWIFYIDADPACGQIGGAGTSGVAVLPANDLRGLTGQQNIPPCPTDPPDNGGVNRWIGGLGHELGHAFGLPHPSGCEDNDSSTPCPANGALMYTGYTVYPYTSLMQSDKVTLNSSAFFFPTTGVDAAPPTTPSITGPSIDNGESSIDHLTNDTTPTFSWTASTDAGGSGLAGYWWSVDDSTPESGGTLITDLANRSATPTVSSNGSHTFFVRAVDGADNLSAVSSLSFEIDTIMPTVASITPADGSIVSAGPSEIVVHFSEEMDRVTAQGLSASNLSLGGAGKGTASVTDAIWLDADSARFAIGGSWGTGQVTVQLISGFPKDRVGNALASYNTGDFTIALPDTTPPSAPPIVGMTDDTGPSPSDGLTNDTTPTFTWTASNDSGGSGLSGYWWSVDDATPESGGTFVNSASLSATANVSANGPHDFFVRAVDGAGNLSTFSSFSLTIDSAMPSVISTTPADGGVVNNGPSEILVSFSEEMDRVTGGNLSASDLTLGGLGRGSAFVTAVAWIDADTARFSIGGTWGTGQVTVQLISGSPRDLAGNSLISYDGGDFTINQPVDTTPPVAPSIPDLVAADDTGKSNTDDLTKINTPRFAGTAIGADVDRVEVLDGGRLLGTAVLSGSAPNLTWTFTVPTDKALSDGVHLLTARSADTAGNSDVASVSSTLTVTIDTKAPTITQRTPIPSSKKNKAAGIRLTFVGLLDETKNPANPSNFSVFLGRKRIALSPTYNPCLASCSEIQLTFAKAIASRKFGKLIITVTNPAAIADLAGNQFVTGSVAAVSAERVNSIPATPLADSNVDSLLYSEELHGAIHLERLLDAVATRRR